MTGDGGKYTRAEHAEMLVRDCIDTAALRAREAAAECRAILDRTPDPTEDNFRPGMRLTDLMTASDRRRFKQATLQIDCLRAILEQVATTTRGENENENENPA